MLTNPIVNFKVNFSHLKLLQTSSRLVWTFFTKGFIFAVTKIKVMTYQLSVFKAVGNPSINCLLENFWVGCFGAGKWCFALVSFHLLLTFDFRGLEDLFIDLCLFITVFKHFWNAFLIRVKQFPCLRLIRAFCAFEHHLYVLLVKHFRLRFLANIIVLWDLGLTCFSVCLELSM